MKAHVKDPADILALIDMGKVSMKDDKMQGLSGQIKALRESKAYLFDTGSTSSTGLEYGAPAPEKDEENTRRRNLGLPIK